MKMARRRGVGLAARIGADASPRNGLLRQGTGLASASQCQFLVVMALPVGRLIPLPRPASAPTRRASLPCRHDLRSSLLSGSELACLRGQTPGTTRRYLCSACDKIADRTEARPEACLRSNLTGKVPAKRLDVTGQTCAFNIRVCLSIPAFVHPHTTRERADQHTQKFTRHGDGAIARQLRR